MAGESLVCFCGLNLVSNGKLWFCPNKGTKTAFDKEDRHQGTIVVDKRMTVRETK